MVFDALLVQFKGPNEELSEIKFELQLLRFIDDHLICLSFMMFTKSLLFECIWIATVAVASSRVYFDKTMASVIAVFEALETIYCSLMGHAVVAAVNLVT